MFAYIVCGDEVMFTTKEPKNTPSIKLPDNFIIRNDKIASIKDGVINWKDPLMPINHNRSNNNFLKDAIAQI